MSVYAISDLHGRLDLLQQVQNFLNPNDTIYCLGDCGDRGPDPWTTIKEVFKDKRFIYLMGNHEKMLVNAIEEWKRYEIMSDNYYLLCYNGGERTFDEWSFEPYRDNWYKLLKKLPYTAEYKNKDGYNILMSHAGYTPSINSISIDDLIWDRNHFYDKWPKGHEMDIIIHGHTTIPHMIKNFGLSVSDNKNFDGAFWYAENHKIDIDPGSVFTNKTILFNLDTFDEHIFNSN